MKKIHKNSCASRSRSYPSRRPARLAGETCFLSARHRRGDKSTSMREIDERYDEQRKRGERGGLEMLPEFNNHRFSHSTGRRGLDVKHGCNLGG